MFLVKILFSVDGQQDFDQVETTDPQNIINSFAADFGWPFDFIAFEVEEMRKPVFEALPQFANV